MDKEIASGFPIEINDKICNFAFTQIFRNGENQLEKNLSEVLVAVELFVKQLVHGK